MGKPATLLEGLCGHALSLGADSIQVEYKDGREWIFAQKGGVGNTDRRLREFRR
jgi:hypothetical protein